MRILHVVPTYLPAVRYGGPIFAVHALCKALVQKGHDVQVFTTNIDGTGNSPVPTRVPVYVDNVQVRYYSCPFLRRLYWAPALGLDLHQEIRRIDVVHLHSTFLWPTQKAASQARIAGVPYVHSPRGMLVKELISRRSQIAKGVWIRLFEKSNIEHASAVHLTSQLEAVELERFGWRLPRLAVIANGIDHPLPHDGGVPADIKAISAKQPLVLYLGRLSWKKGLDRLLRAFALTKGCYLAIVGTDDEGLSPALKSLAEKLMISDRVSILPRTIVGTQKEHLFAAARVFVLCSYSENFGNTVLEAMRRRIAVVVTPEVGAAEIVRDSGGGFVAPGEAQPLGNAIQRLAADRHAAQSMGEAGERHVLMHYTWAKVAAEMEALYADLIRVSDAT
jgi:glycosyltransferase involved in cell wall biosynthesis